MSFIKDLFSKPQTVDPGALLSQQAGASAETARLQARLNRPDTYTPFGSSTFEEMGDDRWRATQTLSPELQELYGTQLATGQGIGEAAQRTVGQLPTDPFSLEGVQPFRGELDYGGLTDIPGMGDFDAARVAAEEGAFSRVWDRLGTQFGEERTALQTELSQKGIPMGSEMYGKAFDRFSERKNDARTAAAYDSIAAGRDAFNNLFATSMQARQQGISERGMDVNLANQARQQEISDMLLERTQPMAELGALTQGAPAIQTPQPINMAGVGVAPPDVGGAYGVAAQQQATAQAQRNAGLSGLFNLGSAAIMA